MKRRKEMPEGLWLRCPGCENTLADEGSFQQILDNMTSDDPLGFEFRETTYKDRIKADEKKSGVTEAILIGKAFIKGRGAVLAVMEPNF
ncbi:MAG: hypothetical protein ACYS0H_02295, partial [Planctomycetota bacterium]